jgi:hypothetical protein
LVHQDIRSADLGPLLVEPDAFEGLVAMAKYRPPISHNGLDDLALRIGFVWVNCGVSAAFGSAASDIGHEPAMVRRSDYA